MATIINSSAVDITAITDPNHRLWFYNGMDCCATHAVAGQLMPMVAPRPNNGIDASGPYAFVRAMQGPALDMMQRGIMVNALERRRTANRLNAEKLQREALLNKLARAVWGQDLNPNSSKQLIAFFYTALKLPTQYAIRKTPEGKKRTPSCDHKALETLAKLESKGPGISPHDRTVEKVHLAQPIVALILGIRDVGKKLAVVNSGISADGRLRCSYNVVGTRTGRWSSSSNAFGEGTNEQNITPMMRRMCCADDGKKLGGPDLEQAESRVVAGLVWACTGDDTYWKACESGDLHTIVCTMAYPELFAGVGGWDYDVGAFVGDLRACREIADRKFYRHLSMRDLAKRIGHGSNYWGTAYGIAMQIGDIPVKVVEDFQRRYFRAFPGISKWHSWTIIQVQTHHKLTTPLGRTRIFFGRATDDSTLREAIAHVPQSTIGELLNYMLYRVWDYGLFNGEIMIPDEPSNPYTNHTPSLFRPNCNLLLQVHDSITFQYPDDPIIEAAVIAKVAELMTVSIPIRSAINDEVRELHLPLEFQVGWNWAKDDTKNRELFADGNPDGLTKYRGPGADTRKRTSPAKPSLLDWLG